MSTQIEADAALCKRIQPWKDARQELANLFPTDSALRWFIRKHEPALVATGVLLKLPRGTYIDPVPFAAAALNLMRHGSYGSACETGAASKPNNSAGGEL